MLSHTRCVGRISERERTPCDPAAAGSIPHAAAARRLADAPQPGTLALAGPPWGHTRGTCALEMRRRASNECEGLRRACRLVLFLLGVVSVSALNVNVPGQQKVKLPARAFASVKVGSLVISNLLSIAEILYFEYSFSPVYAVPSSSGKTVIPCSFYGIICYVLFGVLPETSGASLSKLQELACRMRQPVLLFAEGFATNGKALLPFADVVQDTSLCICAVVSVEGWRWKPARTVEGGWTYFLSLLVQPKLSLVVKCIPEECLAFLDQCSDASQRANMVRIDCSFALHLGLDFDLDTWFTDSRVYGQSWILESYQAIQQSTGR